MWSRSWYKAFLTLFSLLALQTSSNERYSINHTRFFFYSYWYRISTLVHSCTRNVKDCFFLLSDDGFSTAWMSEWTLRFRDLDNVNKSMHGEEIYLPGYDIWRIAYALSLEFVKILMVTSCCISLGFEWCSYRELEALRPYVRWGQIWQVV